jgi:hypothetical protein
MSNEDEERIRQLLGNLPKAPAMSEIEIKRFEKFIDTQVEGIKKSKSGSTRNRNFSIAAALILVISGGAIFASQKNSPFHGPTSQVTSPAIPSEQPSATSSENSQPPQPVVKPTIPQTAPNQQFGVGGKKVSTVGIYATGLAYDGELAKIRAIVKKFGAPSMLGSLSESERNCAIQQGADSALIAFDQGTYQDAPAFAFYTGKSLANATILVTDQSCVVLDQISNK